MKSPTEARRLARGAMSSRLGTIAVGWTGEHSASNDTKTAVPERGSWWGSHPWGAIDYSDMNFALSGSIVLFVPEASSRGRLGPEMLEVAETHARRLAREEFGEQVAVETVPLESPELSETTYNLLVRLPQSILQDAPEQTMSRFQQVSRAFRDVVGENVWSRVLLLPVAPDADSTQ